MNASPVLHRAWRVQYMKAEKDAIMSFWATQQLMLFIVLWEKSSCWPAIPCPGAHAKQLGHSWLATGGMRHGPPLALGCVHVT